MPRFLSLAEAVEDCVRDGDTVAMEGFTHLIPHAAGHEVIRQRRRAPHPDQDDARPDLRPAHRHGLRRQARVLLGRQSGRRLAAPLPRRGRERLAASARDRGALPRRHGQRLRGRRGRAAVRDLPRLHRRRPAEGQSEHQAHHLPVHRRGARRRAGASGPTSPSSMRSEADRAGNVLLEGIVGVQKEVVLAAKRSIVTVEEIVEDFGPRSFNAVILPGWTVGADRAGAGRRLSVLCAGLLQARQRLLHRLGQDRARARDVPRLDEGERAGAGPGGVRRACAARNGAQRPHRPWPTTSRTR